MAYLDINGKKIYFEEYDIGKNPTLVYMHGGPDESCLTYAYQAQKLGEYFHVISFDQYGVFRSDAIPEETKADVKYHIDIIEQMRIHIDYEWHDGKMKTINKNLEKWQWKAELLMKK